MSERTSLQIRLTVNGKYVVESFWEGLAGGGEHSLHSFDSLQEVFEHADTIFPAGD